MQDKEYKALKRSYREVFDRKGGAKVLEDLENMYHIHGTTWREDGKDMAFSEGQRTVVLYIKDMLRIEEDEVNADD